MDETKNLSETKGSIQPVEGSRSSSDEAKTFSEAKGSPITPSQVEAIFFAALEKKTAVERADYLEQACGSDAALRLRVERLLDAHPQAKDFLAQPAVDRPDFNSHVVTEEFTIAPVDVAVGAPRGLSAAGVPRPSAATG